MSIAIGLFLLTLPLILVAALVSYIYYYVRKNFLAMLERIFEEKPLFIIPRGEPDPTAEDIRFSGADGMHLQGCYFKTLAPTRQGVVLFGIEYGSDRWSCRSYCEPLIQAGYDVFVYEPRNQGKSDFIPNYDPLQWVTTNELADARSAIEYLKTRPDRDPSGIGIFGVSKGANAGLAIAAQEPWVRSVVTDGAFGLLSVVVPYMRHWVGIYNRDFLVHGLMPAWFYSHIAWIGVRRVEKRRNVEFVHVEEPMNKFQAPILMIHGAADSYIKVEMARTLFKKAKGPKDLWVVPKARHNQAIAISPDEYARKVISFFDQHLRPNASFPEK
jgi:pimeloyl-ACP methyl ester carboxylesterase